MANPKIMLFKLENLRKGIFLSRPNRFVCEIEYNNDVKFAHIHDPGRLKELLFEGNELLITESKGKLEYYVKAVKAKNEWVIIDTALHSKIASLIFQYLSEFSKVEDIRREVPLGKSRIDFMLDGKYLEVKGVTLVKDGVALFPDAPTERGTRHVREIIKHNGMLLFLIFRDANCLKPNNETDTKFFEALSEAREKKIKIFAIRISFDGETIHYRGQIPLCDF